MTVETAWLAQQRWFGSKDRTLSGVSLLDRVLIPGTDAALELIVASFESGDPETYSVVRSPSQSDALADPEVAATLVRLAYESTRLETERGGTLAFWHSADAMHQINISDLKPVRALGAEQSNTSVVYGSALMLKLFRRVRSGINPEIEIGQFLTEQTAFTNAPMLAATISYRSPTGDVSAVGVFQGWVRSIGDAWTGTLRRLEALLQGGDMDLATAPLTRLGEVTAEMHLALASGSHIPAFAPEPISTVDVTTWRSSIDDQVAAAASAAGLAESPTESGSGALGLSGALKTRVHGDYHLGQILETTLGDFVVIDFEGEPGRTISERRKKYSPLKDVAGLLRSLDYARHSALKAHENVGFIERLRADEWHTAARDTFLRAYVRRIHQENPRLLPASSQDLDRALVALEMEKAAYEVQYEASNRPDWVDIPLSVIKTLR